MKKKDVWKFILMALFILALLDLVSLMYSFMAPAEAETPEVIPYTEFQKLVDDGKVDAVEYSTSKEQMKVFLFNDETREMTEEDRAEYIYGVEDTRITQYPAYEDFRKDLLEKDVRLILDRSVTLSDILLGALNLALPVLWIVVMFKLFRMQSGSSNPKRLIQTSDTHFENIIGQDEVLEDIKFIVKLLKDPSLGSEIGAKVPKGLLLVGPPGTGKTLIAKSIAGEAGVPFLSCSGSDFKELFVGMGAKRVRELFATARKQKPCVIFIDEIDSVGRKRDARGNSSEDDQTINALLKEMDGFTAREGVFVIAATNRVEQLDSALIRPGRFDRQITINPPRDWKVRSELFRYYLKDLKVSDDVDVDIISKQLSGSTGADIASVCNEAGIIAMMQNKDAVDMACIEEAVDKTVFKGSRSKEEHFKEDKKVVAYHEAGHAVMSYLNGFEIARASIMGTTSGVGGAVFNVDTDSCFMTDDELRKRIMVAYAGRASESIKFDAVTTGASNDITQATQTMVMYIERYGFDKEFGAVDMSVLQEHNFINGDEVMAHVGSMARELYDKTVEALQTNYSLVEKLADKLLEVETLNGAEIESLLKGEEN